MKILLVEDDVEVSKGILAALKDNEYVAEHEADGQNGLLAALQGDYDAIILDRMLPSLDGLSLVKSLRAARKQTPVLYLTTMSGINDRVEGFDAGGDDYLVKPFAMSELLARLRAIMRRAAASDSALATRLSFGPLEMDLLKRSVKLNGSPLELLHQEFLLLEYFMRNAGQVVTRKMLLENVWDIHYDPRTSLVESNISRLRSRLSRNFAGELIYTVRGVGYSLRVS